jgi:hypothetical protein
MNFSPGPRMSRIPARPAMALGFCLLFALAAGPGRAGQSPTKLRVTAEIANIRQKPDIGSAITFQVPRDTMLTAVSREGDWYLVRLSTEDGRTVTGYVHISLVTVAEQGAAEESAAPPPAGPPPVKSAPPQRPILPPVSTVSVYSPEAKFGLALLAGGNYVLGGDLNSAAQGQADLLGDILGVAGSPAVSPVHIGYVFGGEFTVPLADRISLGLGLDYLRSQRESIVLYLKSNKRFATITRPEMHAYPIRAFVQYSPLRAFYIKLGLEYFLAGISYSYHTEQGLYTKDVSGTATGRGLGAFGGFGLEWNISGALAFIVEATGHYAPLSGFTGDGSVTDSDGVELQESGKLYYYEYRSLNGLFFPNVVVRSKVPTEAGVFNAREAEVDFSGFSLKAGFKVRF